MLPALAHHFLHGQPEVDATRAREYAWRAGEQALDLCAYEDATAYFEQALAVLDRVDDRRVVASAETLADAMRATLAGRFAEGERLAGEAHAIGERVQPVNAGTSLTGQMFVTHWSRGEFERLVPMFEAHCTHSETVYPEIRVGLAWSLAGAGRLDEAQREVARCAAGVREKSPVPFFRRRVVGLLPERVVGSHIDSDSPCFVASMTNDQ